MKMALIISFCLSFVNVVARAQTPGPEGPVVVRSESVTTPASPQLSEPEKPLSILPRQESTANLPDMPKPKQQQRKEADDGYVYYESRIWWRDVNEPVPAWWHALRSPKFLVGVGLLGGLTALQLNEAIKCKPTCSLFFGSNRIAAYAINIPASSAIVWASARSKERNRPKSSKAKLLMFLAIWFEAAADL